MFEISDTPPVNGSTLRDEPINWAGAKTTMLNNPGKWVLVAERVSASLSQSLRRGQNKQFRGDELKHFEFITRKPKDAKERDYPKGFTDVWGKWEA